MTDKQKILISPSILSADFSRLGEGVKNVQEWGGDYVHCDVMDGVFVPNITFGMQTVKAIRKYADIPFDVHLMITEPEKYVEQFIAVGANIVCFHPEASRDVAKTLDMIKSHGVKAGLVLNPDKELDLVLPFLDKLDQVIIMGVFAGFGGQKFMPSVLPKIRALAAAIAERGLDTRIELDGGVTEENIGTILDAGVTVVVAGSAVFKSLNPPKTIERLRG